MKTCLVSLISDQTIPNILVALHFKPDFMLLISTAKMENKRKSSSVLEVLEQRGLYYDSSYHIIEVIEDSIVDFEKKVSGWLEKEGTDYRFVVNLTGGTKLMSIAAYELFAEYESQMVYVPIGKNEFLSPFPKRRPKYPTPLEHRLTVSEYLSAYGFQIVNEKNLGGFRAIAEDRAHLTNRIFSNYREIRPFLYSIGKELRRIKRENVKKGYAFNSTYEVQNALQKKLIKDLGFHFFANEIKKNISESDWAYLRGGWLEEFLFLQIKDSLPSDSDVWLGIEVKDPNGNVNEFDVLFTFNNNLNILECKSLDAAVGNELEMGGTINDFLYKIGALRQNFGLTPKAFLVTTAENVLTKDGEIKQHLNERGRMFTTYILPLLKITDLKTYFREMILKK